MNGCSAPLVDLLEHLAHNAQVVVERKLFALLPHAVAQRVELILPLLLPGVVLDAQLLELLCSAQHTHTYNTPLVFVFGSCSVHIRTLLACNCVQVNVLAAVTEQ